MTADIPQPTETANATPQLPSTPAQYPNINHATPAPYAEPKAQAPAMGLPVHPADPVKMPPPPQMPAEGVVIQISLSPIIGSGDQAMTMIQGRMVPAWDPRLEAMGMTRAEFETTCRTFREVKQQGEPSPAGVILAVLGTIFCCICTICVYCCVVESQKMTDLNNHASALNAQQASRGFSWTMLNDTAVQLRAIPVMAPASFNVQGQGGKQF